MARNLARSLARRGGFDPADVVAEHLAWFATGPPDVGNLTRRVLSRIAAGAPWTEAARRVWEERGPEVSAGNGSVMCCAPLGLAYARRPGELRDLAGRLSALTHWDERCRTAGVAVALAAALPPTGWHASGTGAPSRPRRGPWSRSRPGVREPGPEPRGIPGPDPRTAVPGLAGIRGCGDHGEGADGWGPTRSSG